MLFLFGLFVGVFFGFATAAMCRAASMPAPRPSGMDDEDMESPS